MCTCVCVCVFVCVCVCVRTRVHVYGVGAAGQQFTHTYLLLYKIPHVFHDDRQQAHSLAVHVFVHDAPADQHNDTHTVL